MYAALSVLLVLAWRNAGWIGRDRLFLRNAWTPHRYGSVFGRCSVVAKLAAARELHVGTPDTAPPVTVSPLTS